MRQKEEIIQEFTPLKDIVYVHDGIIDFVGYMEHTGDKEEKCWRWCTYGNLSFTLDEFSPDAEDIEEYVQAADEYEEVMSLAEIKKVWERYNPKPLFADQIDEYSQPGFYYIIPRNNGKFCYPELVNPQAGDDRYVPKPTNIFANKEELMDFMKNCEYSSEEYIIKSASEYVVNPLNGDGDLMRRVRPGMAVYDCFNKREGYIVLVNGEEDFEYITDDNTVLLMDAPTVEQRHSEWEVEGANILIEAADKLYAGDKVYFDHLPGPIKPHEEVRDYYSVKHKYALYSSELDLPENKQANRIIVKR